MPCTQKVKELGWKPKGVYALSISVILVSEPYSLGVILSGSPYSVYDSDSPHVDPDVFELGVPILGICYGLQVCVFLDDTTSNHPHTTRRKSRGTSEARLRGAIIASTALHGCKSANLGLGALLLSMRCSKGWAMRWRCGPFALRRSFLRQNSVPKKGVDVTWRPALCASAGIPCHRPHEICAVCCDRARHEAPLRHPVPPRGDALSAGEGGHLPIRAQHLRMQQ